MVRDNIRDMKPYNPPIEGRASSGYRLLDFNERTVEPSKKVIDAIKEFADSGKIRCYPEYAGLEDKIADYNRVGAGEVVLTNGADQAIDVVFRAYLDKGDKVIIPSPSFAMFYQCAGIQGAKIVKPRYDKELKFPINKVIDSIDDKTKLVVICNPNNPTGTKVLRDDIKKILLTGKPVMVDEVYSEYSKETVSDLIKEYDNLSIVRSFSKAWGLSSLRVGYVISNKENNSEFKKIRGPYDVNMAAAAAVNAALDDPTYMEEYVIEVMKKSKPMLEGYFESKGIKYYNSNANFLVIDVDGKEKVYEGLKNNGILIRPIRGDGLENKIRVSIGTTEDTNLFIQAFDNLKVR